MLMNCLMKYLLIMNKRKTLYIIFFLALYTSLYAYDFPKKTNLFVNDYVGVLDVAQREKLEFNLKLFNDSTSTEILIAIVPDLGGYDKMEYASLLGETWGVGKKDKNNGLVIVVKPKQSEKDRGEVAIATGYGLESVIPDAVVKRIIENEMIPQLKENNYALALENATFKIKQLASQEYTAEEYLQNNEGESGDGWIGLIAGLIAFGFFLFGCIKGRSSSHDSHSNHHGPIIIGGSGGSYSGGGSIGGFGGFGGGSFGGGGAGGSW